jgi:hypothetical protein
VIPDAIFHRYTSQTPWIYVTSEIKEALVVFLPWNSAINNEKSPSHLNDDEPGYEGKVRVSTANIRA